MSDLFNIEGVINYQIFTLKAISCMSYADAYQIGYLGYLKAKKNFNPDKKDKMTLRYAVPYIKGEICKEMAKILKDQEVITYAEMFDSAAEENIDEVDYKDDNTLKTVKACLHRLPIKDREIIEAYYFPEERTTLLDIANKYGVTKQHIHKLKSKAIDLIRSIYK